MGTHLAMGTKHATSVFCSVFMQAQAMMFPNQLRSLVPAAHMVAGQYAAACGESGAAAAHFQVGLCAGMHTPAPVPHNLVAWYNALHMPFMHGHHPRFL